MSAIPGLTPLGGEVRRRDPERFATAMFAPQDRREDLFILLSFNAEVARTRLMVHEKVAGQIRLQWWREVIEGERQAEIAPNPIAFPLVDLIHRAGLPKEPFWALLEAREQDLDPFPFSQIGDIATYASATGGALHQLMALSLGARDEESLAASHAAGTAWALTGLLRSFPTSQAEGWHLASGLDDRRKRQDLSQYLAGQAWECARRAKARIISRAALPAMLSVCQAAYYLKVLEKAAFDPLDVAFLRPRPMPIRLLWSALTGRL